MNDTTIKPSRSRNALVHGLYVKDVLLPWDSKEDFEKLHEDLKAEFSPRGRAEEEAVLDLAFLHWHKQTIWRLWPAAVLADPLALDIVETERKSWSGIRKSLRAAAKDQRTLQGTADAQLAKLLSRVVRLEKKIAAASDNEAIKLIEDKIAALLRVINEHALPLVKVLTQAPNAEQTFDRAYAAESMEKIVRLEAALDARISKVLARLVGLKEFKRTPAAVPVAMELRRVEGVQARAGRKGSGDGAPSAT
jgi:hypothetical protein